MDYFHSCGIMHRDIKPSNIIINTKTNDIKIIDWGLAEYYLPENKYFPNVATRYYKSPEILFEMKNYHYALDIWSLGCIFAELIFKCPPLFHGSDNPDQLAKIIKVLGTDESNKFMDKYNVKYPKEIGDKFP